MYESDVVPSYIDNKFYPSDYSGNDYFDFEDKTSLPNLVKDINSDQRMII